MNEEMTTFEVVDSTGVAEVCNDSGSSGGGFGKLIIGALAVGAGVAAIIYKTKDKREAKRIEKLRAKGYKITPPCTINESDLIHDEDESK